MPEHLRALVVILVFAATVFAIAGAPARAIMTAPGDFSRRRNLWLGITLAAFFAHNFWLFIVLAGLMLHIAAGKDSNKLALVFFVLLAVPPFSSEIPGVGGVRYLFDMHYIRLLCLVVLLPELVREAARHSFSHFFSEVPDKFFYLYVILIAALLFRIDSATGIARNAFLLFVDVVVPYAIASRAIKDNAGFRAVFASYAIGAGVIACVGAFEFLRGWLLYSTLDEVLGTDRRFGAYLTRGDALRAMGTAGQAIPFGYTMAVGIMLLLGLRRYFRSRLIWLAALGVLSAGLLSSYSRGPWLGALVGLIVFCLTGPDKWRNLAALFLCAIVGGAVLVATPIGPALWDRVWNVDTGSFDYRELLLKNALETIADNPLFGSIDFRDTAAMQELIQGQGIIDIVNSYIGIALRHGLIGLFLFAGIFLFALLGAWRRMAATSGSDIETCDIGRSLLAALTCILATIVTVSSISFIPIIYYMMAGLAVAYARAPHVKSSEAAADPSVRQAVAIRQGARS